MDRKIYLGGNSDDAYEFLTRGQLTVRTETVNQYRRALKQGYTAENTFQLTMVGFFTNTGAVLDFMVVAETSKRSLLNTNLALDLPVTVLNYNGTEQHKALETDAAKGMTVGDYAGKKRITDIKTTSTGTTFSDQSCQYEVRELARGDLDHDGVEDALVSVSTRFKGGSGSGAELMVVTRTDGAKRLRLIGKPGK